MSYPCHMKEIFKLKKKYKFKIIEDASHAIDLVTISLKLDL